MRRDVWMMSKKNVPNFKVVDTSKDYRRPSKAYDDKNSNIFSLESLQEHDYLHSILETEIDKSIEILEKFQEDFYNFRLDFNGKNSHEKVREFLHKAKDIQLSKLKSSMLEKERIIERMVKNLL